MFLDGFSLGMRRADLSLSSLLGYSPHLSWGRGFLPGGCSVFV